MSNDEWSKAWPSNMTAPWPVSPTPPVWPIPNWPQAVKELEDTGESHPVLTKVSNVSLRKITVYEPAADIIAKNDLAGGPVFVVPNSVALNSQRLGRIERNNKVPTHDPYTNPGTLIYYECKCGAVLDPGTKSFAALNNAAMDAGWKIRFGEHHYQAYCIECGKEVE